MMQVSFVLQWHFQNVYLLLSPYAPRSQPHLTDQREKGSHCKWPCAPSNKPSPTAGVTCSGEAGSELNLCAPALLPALPRPPLLHMAPSSSVLCPPLKARLFQKGWPLSWRCLLHHSHSRHRHSRCSLAEYCSRLHSLFSLHLYLRLHGPCFLKPSSHSCPVSIRVVTMPSVSFFSPVVKRVSHTTAASCTFKRLLKVIGTKLGLHLPLMNHLSCSVH